MVMTHATSEPVLPLPVTTPSQLHENVRPASACTPPQESDPPSPMISPSYEPKNLSSDAPPSNFTNRLSHGSIFSLTRISQKLEDLGLSFAGAILIFWSATAVTIISLCLTVILHLLFVLTGHAILRSAHNEYSAPLSSSVKIGAVGGGVFGVPLGLLSLILGSLKIFYLGVDNGSAANGKQTLMANRSQAFKIAMAAAEGAATGAVGAAVLRHYSHEDMLDVIQAARAGALGGPLIFTGYLLFFG